MEIKFNAIQGILLGALAGTVTLLGAVGAILAVIA